MEKLSSLFLSPSSLHFTADQSNDNQLTVLDDAWNFLRFSKQQTSRQTYCEMEKINEKLIGFTNSLFSFSLSSKLTFSTPKVIFLLPVEPRRPQGDKVTCEAQSN